MSISSLEVLNSCVAEHDVVVGVAEVNTELGILPARLSP